MRIWLVTVGEPLPVDPGPPRLMRTGLLAKTLASRGHQVLWWTSTFYHQQKQQRSHCDTDVCTNDGYRIKMLWGPSYRRNVSISRFANHLVVAKRFALNAAKEDIPNLILCSLPTLELSIVATRYGKEHGVPVVLDIRDLWPDALREDLGEPLRWFAAPLLAYMRRQAKRACRAATAICASNPGFVEWGLKLAQREATDYDQAFPLGYSSEPPSESKLREAEAFWAEHGIGRDGVFTACFVGTMSRVAEIDTVVEAAKLLQSRGREVRFVLCGTGENLQRWQMMANGCRNVLFPGWVNAAQVWSLLRISQVGLVPYRSRWDFTLSMPNKPVEYLSAGLPIVSSLKGHLQKVLTSAKCGLHYENGDHEGLAAALSRLQDNPGELAEMARNATALYKEKYEAEKVYGDMSSHLEHIASCERLYNVV